MLSPQGLLQLQRAVQPPHPAQEPENLHQAAEKSLVDTLRMCENKPVSVAVRLPAPAKRPSKPRSRRQRHQLRRTVAASLAKVKRTLCWAQENPKRFNVVRVSITLLSCGTVLESTRFQMLSCTRASLVFVTRGMLEKGRGLAVAMWLSTDLRECAQNLLLTVQ